MTSFALTIGSALARPAHLGLLLWLGLALGCAGPLTREQDSADPPPRASTNLVGPDVQDLVRERCGEHGGMHPEVTALLVAELYAAGVQADNMTEALLHADCGTVAGVLREVVAQGGPEVVGSVAERARALADPSYEPVIAAGVMLGLEQHSADRHVRDRDPQYGMAYFPTRSSGAPLATAPEAATLYQAATPGYGVYTFIVYGADLANLSADDRSRYRELLRVIETYVLDPDGVRERPGALAHAFVIPVEPEAGGKEPRGLAEASTIEALAQGMRAALLTHLRARGPASRAARLAERPGPFLVSSIEPRLLPAQGDGPRLFMDLSEIGAGYFYAIVDAYDRASGGNAAADPLESLAARLQRLFSSGRPSPGTAPSGDWLFWFRPIGENRDATGHTRPLPTEPAADLAGRALSWSCRFEFKG